MGKLSIPKLPTIKTKLGCINSGYVIAILVVFFIIFKYFSFLPGKHYEDGHFLALINDEDVRVLHAMGYGLDQNNKQLYSKEGLPIFKQGTEDKDVLDTIINNVQESQGVAASGYGFDASSALAKVKAKIAAANKDGASTSNNTSTKTSTNTSSRVSGNANSLPSVTPSESPGESLDETEASV